VGRGGVQPREDQDRAVPVAVAARLDPHSAPLPSDRSWTSSKGKPARAGPMSGSVGRYRPVLGIGVVLPQDYCWRTIPPLITLHNP
jgi:hypothetical protein